MDEMRQLIRILAKLMPQSEKFLRIGGEDSGGNRVSEDQIRAYLATSLEGAPQPKWGLPDGWGQYLSGATAVTRMRPPCSLNLSRVGTADKAGIAGSWYPQLLKYVMIMLFHEIQRDSFILLSILADLFNWALKTDVITAEQARKCAKRGTGRPWEAVWSQVYSLGVYPDKWPVPLHREGQKPQPKI